MHEVDNKSIEQSWTNFLEDLSSGEANNEKCKVPCKEKWYQIKEIGKLENGDKLGFSITFENKVEITKASLTVDGVTLLSNIGGFIGISKNFLWLIILLMSSVGVIMSRFKLNK